MNCWKCGRELVDDARFCDICGADQTQPQAAPSGGAPGVGSGAAASNELILKIFAGVFAAVFAIYALLSLRGLFGNVMNLAHAFEGIFSGYFRFAWILDGLFGLVLSVLSLLSYVWLVAAMLLLAIKRTPENSDGLLALTVGGVVARGVVELVSLLINFVMIAILYGDIGILAGYLLRSVGGLVLRLLIAVAAAVGAYLIIRFALKETPLAGKDLKTLVAEAKAAVRSQKNQAAV